ncbi:unnamed protein product, partial [Ectocarpus fasciculatus]
RLVPSLPGEAPASGCIDCQGDRTDQATYWLLAWLRTCALANFLLRCAKLVWTIFVVMVRTRLEANRGARPAPALGDNDMEGAPANGAEQALVPPPPQQGTENVPDTALLLTLRPPPPFQGRSISAPERLVSTPVPVTAATASRARANTIGPISYATA